MPGNIMTKDFDSVTIKIDSFKVRRGKLPGDPLDYKQVQN